MSSSHSRLSATEPGADDTERTVPRLCVVADELVAYSYRILDQCLTLCDAAEEVKQTISTSGLTSDDNQATIDEQDEWTKMVTSWRTEVTNIGCEVVQLTADIRVSPLVEQINDTGGVEDDGSQDSVPRGLGLQEMGVMKKVFSKYGVAVNEELREPKGELHQRGDFGPSRHPYLQQQQARVAVSSELSAGRTKKMSLPSQHLPLAHRRRGSVGFQCAAAAADNDSMSIVNQGSATPVPPPPRTSPTTSNSRRLINKAKRQQQQQLDHSRHHTTGRGQSAEALRRRKITSSDTSLCRQEEPETDVWNRKKIPEELQRCPSVKFADAMTPSIRRQSLSTRSDGTTTCYNDLEPVRKSEALLDSEDCCKYDVSGKQHVGSGSNIGKKLAVSQQIQQQSDRHPYGTSKR